MPKIINEIPTAAEATARTDRFQTRNINTLTTPSIYQTRIGETSHYTSLVVFRQFWSKSYAIGYQSFFNEKEVSQYVK